MKTVIYYNVTTGDAFDSDGRLRSVNNPFTVSYGEKRMFEWHLITANSGDKPAAWTPLRDFEFSPTIASLTADDSYVSAYRGTFASVTTGASSVIKLNLDQPEENIPYTGVLRLKKANGEEIEIAYFAAVKNVSGYSFTVNENLEGIAFLENASADVLKQPLSKVSSFTVDASTPASGIFSFSMTFRSDKLKKIFEYSDTDSAETKGLELRVAGLDGENQRVELAKGIVPLTILGVLDQSSMPVSVTENVLSTYQTWTLGLIAAGLEVEFSIDGNSWNSNAVGAWFFRMRPAGVADAQWCIPIPIPQPKTDPDHVEHSFTVASGSDLSTIEIPYTELNVVKPFDSSLFELQADNSELNITHNSNLQIFFTNTHVKLAWNGTFPVGTYILRG